jgi:hypothetical protein
LPPDRSTSSAVNVASWFDVAAIPFAAIAADRPGTLKSRIRRNLVPCKKRPPAAQCWPAGSSLAGH